MGIGLMLSLCINNKCIMQGETKSHFVALLGFRVDRKAVTAGAAFDGRNLRAVPAAALLTERKFSALSSPNDPSPFTFRDISA